MFILEDNSKYILNTHQNFEFPSKIFFQNFTFRPFAEIGQTSGAFLIAQYLQSINFCNGIYEPLQRSYVIENIYNKIQHKVDGYISLYDGICRICQILNKNTSNICMFNTKNEIKHFIHKTSFVLLELKVTDSYCFSTSESKSDLFEINEAGNILDEKISKGFIAYGYDDDYLLVAKSLGTSYGSIGFVKIHWSVIDLNIIKAATILNTYY